MQILLAASTPAIAVLVAIIAYRQYRTDRLRLRRELFDLRFKVFKDAQQYLTKIMKEMQYPEAGYGVYVDAYQRSRFLFPDEISIYLNEIRDRSVKLSVDEKREKDFYDNLNWLVSQAPVLFDKFRPYMKFDV